MTLDDAFSNLETLETHRLKIPPLDKKDVEAYFEIKSDPEVTTKYCLEPDESIEDTRIWVDKRLEDYQTRCHILGLRAKGHGLGDRELLFLEL